MSGLLEALLLEPYPFELFIAYRTDDQKGTGTLNDPLNGATKYDASRTITALTNSGSDPLEATATIDTTLTNGDVVTVEGVSGAGAPVWNGTFPIYGVSGNTFKYYMLGQPAAAAGGLNSTAKALKVSANGGFRLDDILAGLTAATHVHLGETTTPGRPFLTRGYADGIGGWQMKPGMRISGAGMEITTLKLIPQEADAHFYAIGHALTTGGSPNAANPMDFCEAFGMSIDCNLTIRPGTGRNAACGAVRLMGNHVKIHQIGAKNWGSNSTSRNCFVVAVITADRSVSLIELANAGIANCIATNPAPGGASGPVGISTIFHAGGKEDAATNAEGYGKAPYIRNCFVDCGSLDDELVTSVDIRALSMGWCRTGVVEGNQVHNMKIGGPYQDKATTRDLVVRNNFYKNVERGPWWKLGTLNEITPASTNPLVRDTGDHTVALATTAAAHGLQVGDRLKINVTSGPVQYKGVFKVKDVPTLTQFKYQMESDPGTTSVSGVTFHKLFGVTNIVVERNTIELTTEGEDVIAIELGDNNVSGVESPDYVYTDAIIRDNKIRYLDDLSGTFVERAIDVSGVKEAVIRDNVITSSPADLPIRNFRCGTVGYFNNKTPAGALIQGYNAIDETKYSELETEAEDALLLSLI